MDTVLDDVDLGFEDLESASTPDLGAFFWGMWSALYLYALTH